MYGVADEYSDAWPGRSGESAEPAVGDVANDEVMSVGDCRVGLCDGACRGFFGSSDKGGECRTSDCEGSVQNGQSRLKGFAKGEAARRNHLPVETSPEMKSEGSYGSLRPQAMNLLPS